MSEAEQHGLIGRREAVRRVSAILGGIAFVGGTGLLEACERERAKQGAPPVAGAKVGAFEAGDVALLDEIADTILPTTKTPGAKAAKTGAFMALMVTDAYDAKDQKIFRDGLRKLDDASRKASGAPFMTATPAQRLALLESLDREQKTYTDAREAAQKNKASPSVRDTTSPAPAEAKSADAYLSDQRKENTVGTDVGGATAITADAPAHYFRMMKELALLGYFTSEIGYTQAQRYVESPGRFDPCAPYAKGDRAWAPHA